MVEEDYLSVDPNSWAKFCMHVIYFTKYIKTKDRNVRRIL